MSAYGTLPYGVVAYGATITPPAGGDVTLGLTGVVATTATGTINAVKLTAVALTGSSFSTALGTVGVTQSFTKALTATPVTTATGTVVAGLTVSLALTGTTFAASTGTLAKQNSGSVQLSVPSVNVVAGALGRDPDYANKVIFQTAFEEPVASTVFYDKIRHVELTASGVAQGSNAQSLFGTTSVGVANNAGSTNYIVGPYAGSGTVYDFGSAAYTIECQFYFGYANNSGNLETVFGVSGMGIFASGSSSHNYFVLTFPDGSFTTSQNTLTEFQWHHCALSFEPPNSYYVHINGVQHGPFTHAAYGFTGHNIVFLGKLNTVSGQIEGCNNSYINNARITTGVRRYVGNFTPSAVPYGGTSDLGAVRISPPDSVASGELKTTLSYVGATANGNIWLTPLGRTASSVLGTLGVRTDPLIPLSSAPAVSALTGLVGITSGPVIGLIGNVVIAHAGAVSVFAAGSVVLTGTYSTAFAGSVSVTASVLAQSMQLVSGLTTPDTVKYDEHYFDALIGMSIGSAVGTIGYTKAFASFLNGVIATAQHGAVQGAQTLQRGFTQASAQASVGSVSIAKSFPVTGVVAGCVAGTMSLDNARQLTAQNAAVAAGTVQKTVALTPQTSPVTSFTGAVTNNVTTALSGVAVFVPAQSVGFTRASPVTSIVVGTAQGSFGRSVAIRLMSQEQKFFASTLSPSGASLIYDGVLDSAYIVTVPNVVIDRKSEKCDFVLS